MEPASSSVAPPIAIKQEPKSPDAERVVHQGQHENQGKEVSHDPLASSENVQRLPKPQVPRLGPPPRPQQDRHDAACASDSRNADEEVEITPLKPVRENNFDDFQNKILIHKIKIKFLFQLFFKAASKFILL